MADVTLDIAGRRYRVACADGQEAVLTEAGGLIAAEAEALATASGDRFASLSEVRVLLMAGLMLADRHLEAVRGGAVDDAVMDDAAIDGGAMEGGSPDAAADPAPEMTQDPAQAARIADLEAALAEARASEAAALAALDEAAGQVRALAAELRDDEAA